MLRITDKYPSDIYLDLLCPVVYSTSNQTANTAIKLVWLYALFQKGNIQESLIIMLPIIGLDPTDMNGIHPTLLLISHQAAPLHVDTPVYSIRPTNV